MTDTAVAEWGRRADVRHVLTHECSAEHRDALGDDRPDHRHEHHEAEDRGADGEHDDHGVHSVLAATSRSGRQRAGDELERQVDDNHDQGLGQVSGKHQSQRDDQRNDDGERHRKLPSSGFSRPRLLSRLLLQGRDARLVEDDRVHDFTFPVRATMRLAITLTIRVMANRKKPAARSTCCSREPDASPNFATMSVATEPPPE